MNNADQNSNYISGKTGDWEIVIGLEIHAQVLSSSKLFSGASTEFGKDPNHNVSLVDAAIKKSELGLNPQIDGQLIRLPIPELNEERRTELKKLIKSMGEKCKISIRNIRRDANEELKKLLKSKEIGEDEEKSFEKNVQNITDKHIQIVDDKVSSKEKEIMTI